MIFVARWLAAALTLTGLCSAQSLAVVPSGGVSGTDARPFMIGYAFSVAGPTVVTGLGYLDVTGAGLVESHMVGIFNSATGALLVSANIPSGTQANLVDGFRTEPVSYSLTPGTYVIGGLKMSSADNALVQSPSVSSVSGIQYIEERELQTSTFTMPTTNFSLDEVGSFGPGFVVSTPQGAPQISGLSNSGSFQPVFAANTYISIFGSGLAQSTRSWSISDFGGGVNAPTSLDGVSVSVGGSAAYVEYISSSQLNIIVPPLSTTGSGIPVVVKVPGQQPVTAWLANQALAPAFFTWQTGTSDTGKYLVAQHADYTNVGKIGLFPSQSTNFTTPAKAGEVILLYGTGFGPTTPAVPAGIITDKIYPLLPLPTATIGGLNATVTFAGLIPTLTQVYQFNITIPAGLPSGDSTLLVNINGTLSATGLITISN